MTNALVRSCFPRRDGNYLITVHLSKARENGRDAGTTRPITHDKPLDDGQSIRVEGDKIVGVGR